MFAKIFRPALFATLATAALTHLPSLHAAIPAAEYLLPSDTLALFTVPDANALRAASKQSSQLQFWNSDVMEPFRANFVSKLSTQYLTPLEHELGVNLSDFAALPQGQFTVAITQNGWTGGSDANLGYIFLLDAGAKSDLLQTNLAQLTQKWLDSGKLIRTETLHGIKFSVVPMTSNAIPAALSGVISQPQPMQELGRPTQYPKVGEIVFGQYESLLIVGNSIKAVEPVAARVTGGAITPLADNSLFAADKLAQFRDSPVYYGWLNGKALFGTLASHPAEAPNPEAPSPYPQFDPRTILNATGLIGLKSASFGMFETSDGSLATIHLGIPESERAGLFKMFAFSPKESSPPPFVPANAVKFYRVRMNGRQLWDELQKMVASISPQYLASLNAVIDMANTMAQQKTPGFDLRTALIGNLTDDIISYEKAPSDTDADPAQLMLVGVVNADQAIGAIKMVAGLVAPQDDSHPPRDFLGHKIYTIALRATANPTTGAPVANSLYVASSGGYLALSTDSSIVEEYLRSSSGNVKPLRDTPGLAEAAQHVGGMGGGLFGYENQRETIRALFKQLKNSVPNANSTPAVSPMPFDVRSWMDFSLLPDFDLVAKYFNFSVYAGNVNSEGINFKMYAPHPPQVH